MLVVLKKRIDVLGFVLNFIICIFEVRHFLSRALDPLEDCLLRLSEQFVEFFVCGVIHSVVVP